MTKTEFVKKLAAETGLTQKDAKELNDIYWNVLFEAMKDTDGISPVVGIKFMTVSKEAHTARNPRTGESIKVPEKIAPKVKFGATVKNLFN